MPRGTTFRRLALAAGFAAVATAASAQDAPAPKPEEPKAPGVSVPPAPPPGSPATPPQGSAREQMWPAATAEGWKKPCLVTWQRTWEDAIAVSKETGKPILVCVNMDGEIASEHYAGVRYRQPEIAKLYEPYVTVIASVYRHTPRDYDDEGHRILCPRFGSVTCGEHIAIEPVLYEKYFDGQRIAPRHIMIELDGKESYDVYYANDTASVFKRIEDGIASRPAAPPPVVRGDRPVAERVASREVTDRTAVETAYANGDAAQRRALLDAAIANPQAAPVDLLRLAVFGFDTDLSRLARQALAKSESPAAVNVIAEALRVPMEDSERDALIAALERLGESSRRAQWLAVVHKGLVGKSDAVSEKGWEKPGATYEAPAVARGWTELDERRAAGVEAARAKPDDPGTRLALAETYIELAMEARRSGADDPRAARVLAQHMFDDARIAALQAEKLGGKSWRSDTILALSAYYGGSVDEAYVRAESAVKDLPPGESGWNSMAVLTVFAEARWKAIQKSIRAKQRWPAKWLTDLNAANMILLRHPKSAPSQAVWHYDFLDWLTASAQAARYLDEALERFPASGELHERFRKRVLAEKGIGALEGAYEAKLKAREDDANLLSFAALAASTTAEYQRKAGARDEAMAAWGRAIGFHERVAAAAPERRDAADHAIALAMAGRARLAYEMDDDDRALAEILASFARRPDSAGSRDATGITPGETAQMLLARLRERKKDQAASQLAEALVRIDPELLRPDRGLAPEDAK